MTLPEATNSANGQRYAYNIWSLLNQSVLYDPDQALEKDPEAFEKMQRDAVISGAFDQLHIQVAGADWTFSAGGPQKEDRRLAGVMEQLLRRTQRFPSILYNLAMADFKGCTWGLAELEEQEIRIDGLLRKWWVVKSVKDVDKRRIRLQRFEGAPEEPPFFRWMIYAQGQWNDSGSVWWKDLDEIKPEERWIQHIVDTSERGLGYGYGLAADIYYLFYIKAQALKILMQGLGRWGNGIVTHGIDGLRDGDPSGTPGGMGQQSQQKAVAALASLVKMRQEASYVYDSRDKLDIMKMPADGAEFCLQVVNYADAAIKKRILGPAPGAETDDGKGSHARDKVREAQGRDKIRFLQAALETTWDERITRPILIERNLKNLEELGLLNAAQPTLRIAGRESYDPEIGGRVLFTASQLGMPVRKDEAYSLLGLTPPNEGDEVLDPREIAMLARGSVQPGDQGPVKILGDAPAAILAPPPEEPAVMGQQTGKPGPGLPKPINNPGLTPQLQGVKPKGPVALGEDSYPKSVGVRGP